MKKWRDLIYKFDRKSEEKRERGIVSVKKNVHDVL